jgi:hypothetical protein
MVLIINLVTDSVENAGFPSLTQNILHVFEMYQCLEIILPKETWRNIITKSFKYTIYHLIKPDP